MPGLETVFASPWQLVAAGLILIVAEAIYVLLGFGAGLVAVGALALLIPDVRDVVVVLLLVNLPAELFVVASSWRQVAWRNVAVITVGIAVGVPVGGWLLGHGDTSSLLVALGAFLVAVGVVFLAVPLRPHDRRRCGRASVPVGVASGVLTGLFGTGGPPLVLYYQLAGLDKAEFRANLMAIFMLMTAFRVPTYAALGLITPERLISTVLLLPAVAVGAWIGNTLHLSLDERAFRRLVAAALVALGVLLVSGAGR